MNSLYVFTEWMNEETNKIVSFAPNYLVANILFYLLRTILWLCQKRNMI